MKIIGGKTRLKVLEKCNIVSYTVDADEMLLVRYNIIFSSKLKLYQQNVDMI